MVAYPFPQFLHSFVHKRSKPLGRKALRLFLLLSTTSPFCPKTSETLGAQGFRLFRTGHPKVDNPPFSGHCVGATFGC